MRQFIFPLIIIALGGPNIEQTILSYLNSHYPQTSAQYVCDASTVNNLASADCDSVAVDGFGKDNPMGQVVVRLSFFKNGERIGKTSAGIRVGILKSVLVADAPIKAGEPLTSDKIRIETRDVSISDDGPLETVDQASGMVASRHIPAGRILCLSAFKRPPTLSTGDHVTIRFLKGALSLNTAGVAREDGFAGEQIRVMNFNSKKVITAVVIDSTTVAIGEGL